MLQINWWLVDHPGALIAAAVLGFNIWFWLVFHYLLGTSTKFKPCVAYFDDMRLTQILLANASTVSVALKIPGVEGHCVDLLYDMYTDELVGVQIWDDVRKPRFGVKDVAGLKS